MLYIYNVILEWQHQFNSTGVNKNLDRTSLLRLRVSHKSCMHVHLFVCDYFFCFTFKHMYEFTITYYIIYIIIYIYMLHTYIIIYIIYMNIFIYTYVYMLHIYMLHIYKYVTHIYIYMLHIYIYVTYIYIYMLRIYIYTHTYAYFHIYSRRFATATARTASLGSRS